MSQKDTSKFGCRLRIDPVLVDKFRRLQGGINEVGTKIVRDLGLKYHYDKHRGTLDIIGPDEEILGLAVETLRFWIEEDEFPNTGITCQVGYPNRNIVVWRFHGDYAKKFDRLFVEDIAKLKLIISVNIKAVPTKRNPEYVELYCHFSVYHHVKEQVKRISYELSKIFQDDFFIPKSDLQKAKDFAIGYGEEDKVLYALKEYPDNKIRVWIFARNHFDVIRARKEWVTHVEILTRDNKTADTPKQSENASVREASFIDPVGSAVTSNRTEPIHVIKKPFNTSAPTKKMNQSTTSTTSKLKPKTGPLNQVSPRVPKIDNANFPRPPDFAYPIRRMEDTTDTDDQHKEEEQQSTNPFVTDSFAANTMTGNGSGVAKTFNPMAGESRWVTKEDGTYKPRIPQAQSSNRIYVHHQVGNPVGSSQVPYLTGQQGVKAVKQVVHPEVNLVPKERYNPTHYSRYVLTSITDPHFASTLNKNKNTKPGDKAVKKPKQPAASMRQRPKLKANQPEAAATRYNINVNGLSIYMYKQNIVKLSNMDALVNTVTSDLKQGDLVATEMFEAMGRQVLDEINVHLSLYGEVETTDNIVTSAGKIPALGIIHVVSPIWQKYTVWEDCASDLHKAVYNALKTAEAHKYRKIAIPTIGSEPRFGIPKDLVAEVYVKALIDYSMGMGPMYPVLEIHLVDTDPNMLNYIKDAYESWASTPGMADDMTKHIRTDAGHAVRDPRNVSDRAQSAVSLREIPSHRSENMVTFMEQSYTADGEQKWTFDVLKRLIVHVYTGSVEKLVDVDAIVCGVDANFKGTLVRSLLKTAGKEYERALEEARGNRTMAEGGVVVVNAGQLPIQFILHSVIVGPIYTASQRNISRLDNINSQVLFTANRLGITRLAMPLIGTGRIRERFEVEQCSLQLVDNIIEMGLTFGMGLKVRELHLVNVNHVMTQYLTQALRTRAHQKLRIETEPHPPSRIEVLSQAEANRGNPDNMVFSKSAPVMGTEDNTGTMGLHGPGTDEKPRDESTPISNIPATTAGQNLGLSKAGGNTRKKDASRKGKSETGQMTKNSQKKTQKKETHYLSERNLEAHTQLQRDAWMQLEDDDLENPSPREQNINNLEPLSEEEQLHKSDLDTKSDTVVKVGNGEKKKQRQRRIIQRSSDFILQKSKADSYSTLHERKQKYTDHVQQNEQRRLRKTQSNDDLHSKALLSERLLNGFETERLKLIQQKEQETLEEMERQQREMYIQQTQKYFTRGTRDRYKQGYGDSDPTDEFDKVTRIDVRTDEESVNHKRPPKPMPLSEKTPRKPGKGTKAPIIDHDREDAYMMDMDFLLTERDQMERDLDSDEDTNTEVGLNRITKTERKGELRPGRFPAHAVGNKGEEERKYGQTQIQPHRKPNNRKLQKPAYRTKDNPRHDIPKVQFEKVETAKPVVYANKRELYRNLEVTLQSKHRKIESIEETVRRLQERSPRKQYTEPTHPVHTWDNDMVPVYPHHVYEDTKHYAFDAYVPLPRHLSYEFYERTSRPPVRRALTVENVSSLAKQSNKQGTNRNKTTGLEGKKSVKSTKTSILRQNKFKDQTSQNTDDAQTEKLTVRPGEETKDASQVQTNGNDNHVQFNDLTGDGMSPEQEKVFPITEPLMEGNPTPGDVKPPEDAPQDENTFGNDDGHAMGDNLVMDPVPQDVSDHGTAEENGEIVEDKTFQRSDSNTASLKEFEQTKHPSTPYMDEQFEQTKEDDTDKNHVVPMPVKTANTAETRKPIKTYTLADSSVSQVAKHKSSRTYEGYKQKDRKYPKGKQQKPTERIERVNNLDLLMDQTTTYQTQYQKPKKLDSETVEIIRQDLQRDVVLPRPEDVTIRDKIRLEIDVVDQSPEPLDETRVSQEKQKIKRFWEVVGGRNVNDEELYEATESDRKEKVIVAKVTKERKMSAKSKSSKRSKMSSVHNVGGKYNVTVEVAN